MSSSRSSRVAACRRAIIVTAAGAAFLVPVSVAGAATSGTAIEHSATGIFDKNCAGKPAAHIIKWYTEKDGTQEALRCGTSGYGYNHIKARHGFTGATDRQIADTLKNYTSVKNDSQTSQTFFLNGYRVVVEDKPFSDGYGQGIITAY